MTMTKKLVKKVEFERMVKLCDLERMRLFFGRLFSRITFTAIWIYFLLGLFCVVFVFGMLITATKFISDPVFWVSMFNAFTGLLIFNLGVMKWLCVFFIIFCAWVLFMLLLIKLKREVL